jgi:hypothetical protein
MLLVLAAAAVLVVAAVGRHALSTEGGTTMPDLFRSRGRRNGDDSESRQAAGVELAAAQKQNAVEPDAATGDSPPDKAEETTAPVAAPALEEAGRVGEHVAGIVAAAESAASTIRADAEHEAQGLRSEAQRTLEEARAAAAEVKAEADVYSETKRRDADANAARIVAEAERRAAGVSDQAVQRDRVLLANIAASEQRLRDLARSLRTVAGSLDDVVGDDESGQESEDNARVLARADDEAAARDSSLTRF